MNKKIQKELQNNKRISDCALRYGITGDKTRLQICYLLCHYPELSVSEIADLIGSPVSTISRSLKKLKEVGVVASRRQAKKVFYSFGDNTFTHSLKKELLA